MNAYECLQAARAPGRPTAMEYVSHLVTDFLEMHGDRRFGDDKAVVTGIGRIAKRPVTVIALEKGRDTAEKVRRNFGSAHPEGYRKALRQMKLAEKFHRPVLCLVDTVGAYSGIGAEERGQGLAIAENLMEMMGLKTPVISLFIGEGGSGGALALAVADEVWMMENAVYSVISPEGCASILWKAPSRTKEACEHLKMTAEDLLALGAAERVFGENGGAFEEVYPTLARALSEKFQELEQLPTDELLRRRYQKFRKMGAAEE